MTNRLTWGMPAGSAAIFVVVTTTLLRAQTATPQALVFETASVKPDLSASPNGGARFQPGGLFTATNLPLRSLVAYAFRTTPPLLASQIVGLPDWAGTDRYDITARVSSPQSTQPDATLEQASQYVRSLLEQRFNLRAHFEKRDLAIYALTIVAPDGRLGPAIRPSAGDCAARAQVAAAGAPNGGRGAPPAIPCGIRIGGIGRFQGGDVTISTLVGPLANATGRVVEDRTQLAGRFDVTLEWAADPAGADAGDTTSIFTAIQEQLGLKLESTRAPVDVLVIDRVERPTEN